VLLIAEQLGAPFPIWERFPERKNTYYLASSKRRATTQARSSAPVP